MNIHINAFDTSKNVRVDDYLSDFYIHDQKDLHLKKVLLERSKFGIDKLSVGEIEKIADFKYDEYFIGLISNVSKVGSKKFTQLRDAGRLELTTEYIVFHNFRDKLDSHLRRAIAKELANSVSHPHAKWEERSGTQQIK